MNEKDLSRFLDKVDIPNDANDEECWKWIGVKHTSGYGTFMIGGAHKYSHRAIYEHCNGKIENGLMVHHKCNNKLCVNPAHLALVTARENSREYALFKSGGLCKRGHELSEGNFYYRKNGSRMCLQCCKLRAYSRYYGSNISSLVNKLSDEEIEQFLKDRGAL